MQITALLPLLCHPISFIVLIFIFLLHKFCFPPIQSSSSSQPLPPSPPKLPIFGNLLNLGSHPYITFATYARRYGPLFLLHLGNIPTLVVSSAEMARQILKTHDLAFSNRPKSTIGDKIFYGSMDVMASPYGEYWRQMKSVCMIHMLSNTRVQSFRSVREEETKLMIRHLAAHPSMSVNLSEIVTRLAIGVVSRVALGRKYGVGEDGQRLGSLLLLFGEVTGAFGIRDCIPWLGWIDRISGLDSKTERVAKEFDAFITGVIEEHVDSRERQNQEEHKDLVDVLLWIQRENTVGFPLETVSIKALILDMFTAGTDTSSTVLEWAMSRLLKHPRVMKKLQSEVRETAGEKTYISENDLKNMHYLKAVIKETMRVHPPVPLLGTREPTQDIKVSGYHIAARTLILINAWHIGRDPEFWPEPEEFRPERFLNNPVDFKGHDFHFLPFGAGRRGCPGISFATVIVELALANLVLNFDWSLPVGEELDMTELPGLVVHRKFPLLVVATPRTTS